MGAAISRPEVLAALCFSMVSQRCKFDFSLKHSSPQAGAAPQKAPPAL